MSQWRQNMIFTSGLVAPCNNKNSNMGGVIPVRTYNFATNNNLITWSTEKQQKPFILLQHKALLTM